MRYTYYYILLVLCLSCVSLTAQENLTQQFRFTDGIYTTFQDCQQNRPTLTWEEVQSKVIVIEALHKAKMSALQLSSNGKAIDLNKVWGFSLNGIPYVRIVEHQDSFALFSAIQLRGNLAYYEYKFPTSKAVIVSAYNVKTGKPFRSQKIRKEQEVHRRKLLQWETGIVKDFTMKNVASWIAQDETLYQTYLDTEPKKRLRKLLKFVRIFNDRNLIKI